MKPVPSTCNFLYSTVVDASVRADSQFTRMQNRLKELWDLPYAIYSPIKKSITRNVGIEGGDKSAGNDDGSLDLQPGEWVEVRSIEEIRETLDEKRKCKGLYFMPEMADFCGMTYRVFKSIKKIKLESTGELRQLRSPTVFLEGAYCSGERHEGCDRACFHFWREAWLKRVAGP